MESVAPENAVLMAVYIYDNYTTSISYQMLQLYFGNTITL